MTLGPRGRNTVVKEWTMAANPPANEGPRPTLGLTGLTVNAMALIAPGAFLWTTFASQSALAAGSNSTASDMWFSLIAALVIAYLTALCYSELANIYPRAGAGSSYYFAEAAFLDKEKARHQRWARVSKMTAGWISHLYYWIYPGILVAYIATLFVYVFGLFGTALSQPVQIGIALVSAVLIGFVALRGINGSTMTALAINVIQLVTLVIVASLLITFRLTHGNLSYAHNSAFDVITPHSLRNVVYQGSIAILLLVGFESVTALGAEAKDPKKHVRQAILLSLTIQGVIAYLFEYFAANFFVGDHLVGSSASGAAVSGYSAAAASGSPLGDMLKYMGDHWFSHIGTALACLVAITVVLALVGSILSAMNTGVRITYVMGRDKEMPGMLGFLHGKYATPHWGVLVMVVISAAFGMYGVINVDHLTQITLASNVGTFILYGITCLVTLVAFWSRADGDILRHKLVPALGAFLNIFMMLAVFYIAFSSGGNTATDGQIAIGIVAAWVVLGVAWYVVNSARHGRALISAPSSAV
jgi:basic amino acid/polyamine antiporter, APA family